MDELDGHGALPDRGGTALDRARPDVADREDAWDARLQETGPAGVGSGEQETVVVARNGSTEPVRAGRRAEKHECELHRQPRAVLQGGAIEPSVLAVQLRDLTAVAHL